MENLINGTLLFFSLFIHANTSSISVHFQAWEDTHAKWDQATKQILNFPKNKADDGQVSVLKRTSSLYLVSEGAQMRVFKPSVQVKPGGQAKPPIGWPYVHALR